MRVAVIADEDDGAATDVSQLQVAVQRPASDDLQSQLWCWLTDGRLYSAAGNSAVVSVHKRAGSPVLVQRGSHEIKGVLTKWCIGGDGAISCDGGDVVMDGKASGVASESADVGIRPRRSFAPSSQRWIAVPQPAPDLDPDVPGPAVCTFKLISTSGKALDTCADGRLSTFDPHPGSKTQRWRFLCGPHGLYLDNAHTDEVATLHWAESAKPDGDAHLSQVRISARTPALYDRQLWSFDTKGFLVSRHSGWVLESLSLQEGGAVAATTRRTSVAGLGLFFKNFSTDSQIWHVVPADPLGGIHRPRSRPKSKDKEESRDVYSSEFLDAALAELDEFGADLDESRSMSPNGCDEALEALDRMSTELNRRDNLDDSEGEAGSAIASPPPSPRATPPSLDRNATADELWVKLARPAFQNTALKQITEHVWLLFEEDFTGRLTGDLLK
jgi:hypothetical protein